jgi:hypothetical protein
MYNLESFIVKAKANGWAGAESGGKRLPPSKEGSFDITFDSGDFHYHDSFVGGSDFCGQEHVTLKGKPVWSMVYYGYLLKPQVFNGKQVIAVLKDALSAMYKEGRFLGEFNYRASDGIEYRDINSGNFQRFNGTEKIFLEDESVYELVYCGGVVKE